jgi:hypothetical protein
LLYTESCCCGQHTTSSLSAKSRSCPRTAFQCLSPVWHHQQRSSPAPRSSVASRRARGRAVAGRGRKVGQADGRMGGDRGTHRVGSVRRARSTPTERQWQIERQRSGIYPVRWVSVSVVLKFSVLKLCQIGFQLRNPVVYWKPESTGSCRGQAESGARPAWHSAVSV